MSPNLALVRGKQALVFVLPPRQLDVELVERDAILKVLGKAAEDDDFIAELTFSGEQALRDFALSSEAEAALLGGDVRWLEARVGKLDDRLGAWPALRLQQEIW
jgi:hypothetical protein